MKYSLLAVTLMSAIAPFASAQSDSAAYNQCIQIATNTVATVDCIGAETEQQDARLNTAYKTAMAAFEPAQQAQLRDAQRAWIKYRDANCGMYYRLTGGTMDQINGASCVLEMTKTRATELSALSEH